MALKAFMLATAMSLGALPAQAAFTDFSDLTVGDEFGPSVPTNTIHSSGFEFTVINGPNETADTAVSVVDETFAEDPVSGKHLFFQNQVGVTLDLLPGTESLSFSFGSTFSDVTLAVNADSIFAGSDLVQLDGTTIDGVLISIDSFGSSTPFGERGTLMLTGDINEFSITGTELAFDNFTADNFTTRVPEPGTSGITFMAACGIILLCRRVV